MRGLIGILESPPPAHVVDQNCFEIRMTFDGFLQQLLKAVSTLNRSSCVTRVERCFRASEAT